MLECGGAPTVAVEMNADSLLTAVTDRPTVPFYR
jgi:hypothetical protein